VTRLPCRNFEDTAARDGVGYEVAVPIGRDPITKRYAYACEQAVTIEEAEAAGDRMLADLAKGRKPLCALRWPDVNETRVTCSSAARTPFVRGSG
jgi:hypothetical protein